MQPGEKEYLDLIPRDLLYLVCFKTLGIVAKTAKQNFHCKTQAIQAFRKQL